MKPIDFKVIPHKSQRYSTIGDYFEDKNGLHFRVSDMNNPDYEFLVFFHECVEWYLIQKCGIKISEIDAFDIQFEKERAKGKHSASAEPGFSPKSPYRFAHVFASKIEREIARFLWKDDYKRIWDSYAKTVEALP